jgi:hypothetical protein
MSIDGSSKKHNLASRAHLQNPRKRNITRPVDRTDFFSSDGDAYPGTCITSPNLPCFDKETFYADKIEIPSRPDLGGTNVWKYLRQKYNEYLQEAWEFESVSDFVPDAPREEELLVTSSSRRGIELEVDEKALHETFEFTIRGVGVDMFSVRVTAATVLKRLAYAHLHRHSPYVSDVFEAAGLLLNRGINGGEIVERALASEILAHTNPYLPDNFPSAHVLAPMLRDLVQQKLGDAVAHCHAYHGLIHCLTSAPTEIEGGMKTFGSLANMPVDHEEDSAEKALSIKKAAGEVDKKLMEFKGPTGGKPRRRALGSGHRRQKRPYRTTPFSSAILFIGRPLLKMPLAKV